jgi:hypothetical protein
MPQAEPSTACGGAPVACLGLTPARPGLRLGRLDLARGQCGAIDIAIAGIIAAAEQLCQLAEEVATARTGHRGGDGADDVQLGVAEMDHRGNL